LGGDLEAVWRRPGAWVTKVGRCWCVLHRKPIKRKESGAAIVKYAWPFRRAPAKYYNLAGCSAYLPLCRVPLASLEVALSGVGSILQYCGQALCMRRPWWPGKVNYAGWSVRIGVGAAGVRLPVPADPATSNQQHDKACDRVLDWVRPTTDTHSFCLFPTIHHPSLAAHMGMRTRAHRRRRRLAAATLA
jgi:hypothetical protein